MKSELDKFVVLAKAVIYDAKRAKVLIPMMDTQAGAVQAVMSVMAGIEGQREVPNQLQPLLGVSIYMLMVDLAMQVTGEQPDKAIMKKTMAAIMSSAGAGRQSQVLAQKKPSGLLGMGGA